MVFSAETHEARADEWSSREIERQARLFRRAPLRFLLGGNIHQGQVEYEWNHLASKLRVRNVEWHRRMTEPRVHPLFVIVEGEVESWERVT